MRNDYSSFIKIIKKMCKAHLCKALNYCFSAQFLRKNVFDNNNPINAFIYLHWYQEIVEVAKYTKSLENVWGGASNTQILQIL